MALQGRDARAPFQWKRYAFALSGKVIVGKQK
jgi:hypothetical protein